MQDHPDSEEGAEPALPYLDASDVPKIEAAPGFWRQTLLSGQGLMLCLFTVQAGAELPEHDHPHEQSGYVIRGAVKMRIGDETRVLREGMTYFVPSGRSHAVRALEPSVILDAFSPPREEYRAGKQADR